MKRGNGKRVKKVFILLAIVSALFIPNHKIATQEIHAHSVSSDITMGDDSSVTETVEHISEPEDVVESVVTPLQSEEVEDELNENSDDTVEDGDDELELTIDREEFIDEVEMTNESDEISRAQTIQVNTMAQLKATIESKSAKDSGDVYILNGTHFGSQENIRIPQGYSFTMIGLGEKTNLSASYANLWGTMFMYEYDTPIEVTIKNLSVTGYSNAGLIGSSRVSKNLSLIFEDVYFKSPVSVVTAKGATVKIISPKAMSFSGSTKYYNKSPVFQAHTVEVYDSVPVTVSLADATRVLFEVENLEVKSGVLDITSNAPVIVSDLSRPNTTLTISSKASMSVNKNISAHAGSALTAPVIQISNVNLNGSLHIVSTSDNLTLLNTSQIIGDGDLTLEAINPKLNYKMNSMLKAKDIELGSLTMKSENTVSVTEPILVSNTLVVHGDTTIDIYKGDGSIIGNGKQSQVPIIVLHGNVTIIDQTGRKSSIINAKSLEVSSGLMVVDVKSHGNESLFKVSERLNLINLKQGSIISVGKKNTVSESAMISSLSDINIVGSCLEITNELNGYSSIFSAPKWTFESSLNNEGYLKVIDASEKPVLVLTDDGTISSTQVNQWQKKDIGTVDLLNDDLKTDGRFMNDVNSLITIQFSDDGTKTHVSNPMNTKYDHTSLFSVRNHALTSMGTVSVRLDDNNTDDHLISGNTVADAKGYIMSRKPVHFVSNEAGLIQSQSTESIRNGHHKVIVFGQGLYSETVVTYHNEGDFIISEYPTSFNFGLVNIKDGQTIYPRQSSDDIVIYDGRKNLTGWTLSAHIERQLNTPMNDNGTIMDAFIYDNSTKRLSEDSIIVYETDAQDYDPEYVIHWKEDSGLLLYIESLYDMNIHPGSPYSANIVWTLESK